MDEVSVNFADGSDSCGDVELHRKCVLVVVRIGDQSPQLKDSLPFTLMDLECEWIKQHAGIRLCITEAGPLEAELKSLDKPRFRDAITLHEQKGVISIRFPIGLRRLESGDN